MQMWSIIIWWNAFSNSKQFSSKTPLRYFHKDLQQFVTVRWERETKKNKRRRNGIYGSLQALFSYWANAWFNKHFFKKRKRNILRRLDRDCSGGPIIRTLCFYLRGPRILSSVSSVQSLSHVNPMDCSTPGLPVHHQLPESTQTHVHWVGGAIQPPHPLLSPSPPALNLSQHQGLFKWVSSSHQVAKVLELQLQHQSFQWIPRTDLL